MTFSCPEWEDVRMNAAFAGLVTGLSLIVAIGAQNAYVMRMGLTRRYVGLVVTLCAVSDVLLIVLGVAGIGGVVHSASLALQLLRWVGVAYLLYFSFSSFRKARHPEVLIPTDERSPAERSVLATTLALTFLNPHVYIDTVLLLGSIGNQYGHAKWWFAVGASVSSVLWFSTLGFGARFAARYMARPLTWRILDSLIGLIMLLVAVKLLVTPLPA
jgi:L-lysine exporter family protein LysE/ArgO